MKSIKEIFATLRRKKKEPTKEEMVKFMSTLTPEDIKKMLDQTTVTTAPVEGNGKAVFLEYGNDDEFEEYTQNEVKGWGGFIKKVFNLNKNDKTNSE